MAAPVGAILEAAGGPGFKGCRYRHWTRLQREGSEGDGIALRAMSFIAAPRRPLSQADFILAPQALTLPPRSGLYNSL